MLNTPLHWFFALLPPSTRSGFQFVEEVCRTGKTLFEQRNAPAETRFYVLSASSSSKTAVSGPLMQYAG